MCIHHKRYPKSSIYLVTEIRVQNPLNIYNIYIGRHAKLYKLNSNLDRVIIKQTKLNSSPEKGNSKPAVSIERQTQKWIRMWFRYGFEFHSPRPEGNRNLCEKTPILTL